MYLLFRKTQFNNFTNGRVLWDYTKERIVKSQYLKSGSLAWKNLVDVREIAASRNWNWNLKPLFVKQGKIKLFINCQWKVLKERPQRKQKLSHLSHCLWQSHVTQIARFVHRSRNCDMDWKNWRTHQWSLGPNEIPSSSGSLQIVNLMVKYTMLLKERWIKCPHLPSWIPLGIPLA